MNIFNLMHGDWIHGITDNSNYQFGRVCKNHDCHCDVNERLNFNSDVEPIVLTNEMLEKNGFELQHFEFYVHRIDENPAHYDFKLTVGGALSTDGYKMTVGIYLITIRYVHELQHALRMCGLEELANNFKVK